MVPKGSRPPEKQLLKLQTDYFKIADFLLRISHQGEPLVQRFRRELALHAVEPVPSTEASVHFHFTEHLPEIPRGAVLKNSATDFKEDQEYVLDSVGYHLIFDAALIRKDFGRCEMDVAYCSDGELVYASVRNAVKWLIIKTAEARGHAYVHASGVRYRDVSILFVGYPSRGKSSCLYRMMNAGGVPICDDAALIKGNQLAPLGLNLSVKGDFARRFHLTGQKSRAPLPKGGVGNFEKPRLIFFPEVWNHRQSRLVPVDQEEALGKLNDIYDAESRWNAYPLDEAEATSRQKLVLAGTRCFRFFVGREEAEVARGLVGFIDQLTESEG